MKGTKANAMGEHNAVQSFIKDYIAAGSFYCMSGEGLTPATGTSTKKLPCFQSGSVSIVGPLRCHTQE
eukprot:11037948-Prorocentrum_lima.AAC.1